MSPISLDWVTYVLGFILPQILRNITLTGYSIGQYLDHSDDEIGTYRVEHCLYEQSLSWVSYAYISIRHLVWWFFRWCRADAWLSSLSRDTERWVDQKVYRIPWVSSDPVQPGSLDSWRYSSSLVSGYAPDSVVIQKLGTLLWMLQIFRLIHLQYMRWYLYSPCDPWGIWDPLQYILFALHPVYWTRLLFESCMRSRRAVSSLVSICFWGANIHRS